MGPFMVEIVFCSVTRRGRKLRPGMNKAGRANMRNDGCSQSFVPKDDTVKITIDLSDGGPVFAAMDEMMAKLDQENKGRKAPPEGAKKALKNLLKSGIPGIEGMFGGEAPPNPAFPKKGGKKGFHKMNDASKKKFMNAIFGEEGTQIDASTAAALLASICSGGDPNIGNNLAELLMPELGDKVDPIMMAALMSACSLIQAGASTEEVMKIMMSELASSGLSEEQILERTKILMKAFNKEEAGSTAEYKLIGKQKNSALKQAEISPKDFTAIALAHKAIASCGTTPENVGKLLMIKSTLMKKGANPAHVAGSLKNLGQLTPETKAECIENILKAWEEPKMGKLDVNLTVRVHQALDNENEPSWAEVKQMKDIVGGVSANSPEAIELNLARATKSGGLKKDDIGRGLIALKAIASLGVDSVQLAKVMFMEKTIADNGVPAAEIGRVLSDGIMPSDPKQSLINEVKDKLGEDLKPADVEASVKTYNNLKLKSNIPLDVIEHVDKTLIQVRCSLEDVADNMISTMSARGEKEHNITRNVLETLKNTGATANIVSATVVAPFKDLTGKNECELTKVVGRGLKDVDYSDDDVQGAVVEMTIKIIEENPEMREEACAAMEAIMKDFGGFPDQIRTFMKEVLPPPPTPPTPPMDPEIAAQLEKLHQAELARAAAKLAGDQDDDEDDIEGVPRKKPGLKTMDSLKTDSRRGSMEGGSGSRRGSILLGGGERRGSFYDEGVTTRASVAVVTDDPEQKKKLKKDLDGVFNAGGENDTASQQNMNEINSRLGIPLTGEAGTTNSNMNPAEASIILEGSGTPNGMDAIMKAMPANASPEMIQQILAGNLEGTGLSQEETEKLLAVFVTDVLRGGITTVSDESRALMQQILSSSNNQEEISSRVTALLAGTALSTSRGEKPRGGGYGDVKMAEYNLPPTDLSASIPRRNLDHIQGYLDPNDSSIVNGVVMRNPALNGGGPAVNRQSVLLQSRERRRRREEATEEAEKESKTSYYRKITGLRRAKVPLMVYSCGGFSRCFRIARFYDSDGPPVGVTYDRDFESRAALNPDL